MAKNGIEVEVLQTEAAVERFNELRDSMPVELQTAKDTSAVKRGRRSIQTNGSGLSYASMERMKSARNGQRTTPTTSSKAWE